MARQGIYTVIAGDTRPAYIETGFLEKNSGQTQFQEGISTGKVVNRRGDCGIPTISENWGVRLIDGKIPDKPVDVKDSRYSGEIQFLPWGDKKGQLIMTRYLKGYETLDMLYQNLVLNADSNINIDDASSADVFFLVLQTGENEFDETREPFKTMFVKNSAYNQDSTSKNPQHISYMYREKDEEKQREAISKSIDDKGDAIILVKHAASSLDKLRNLFGIVGDLINAEISDELLFDALMNLADRQPTAFMDKMKGYKHQVSNIFEKAKSYGILDLTKDGVIVAGKDKKTIIAQDVPAKGTNMIDWVYSNPVEPISFTAVHQLKQITDKLK